ncbi:MAG: phosphoenolpyruvate--protein phosphotransferase [Pseudomonadota bacterium]
MSIELYAPIAGWVMPLDAVPDPVFAEQMMGQGLAIDPLDEIVRAPCDAVVVAVAPTRHSVTLRLANGAELLIHIGLETVALGGRGFEAKVADGDAVVRGQTLLFCDLDAIAGQAKSLVTPLTIISEGAIVSLLATGRRVAAGDAIATVAMAATSGPATEVGDDSARCAIRVPLANGIHARPAARIVAALKPFAAEVTILAHGKSVNARSIVALLSAGIRHGDDIEITGRGSDVRAAVATVAMLIEDGMGEAGEPEVHPVDARPFAPSPAPTSGDAPTGSARGICAVPGLAVGPVFQFRLNDIAVREAGRGVAEELQALADARAALAGSGGQGSGGKGSGGQGDIAAAHAALLDDPELVGAADALVRQGKSAGFAWRSATRGSAEAIRATGDPLLIERIADLKDIERQLIAQLVGGAAALPQPPAGAIVVADEILPSQIASLVAAGIAGICTAFGGPTSHAAILAAAAGLPMLVAAGSGVLGLDDGVEAILDADAGVIDATPDADRLAAAKDRMVRHHASVAADSRAATDICAMADGTRIEVFANLANADEAGRAVERGAEGCGLLRTEFLFLDRPSAPDEDEQRQAYAAIALALDGRPLIVRTLDVGGDKPLPYLPFPHEDNPALGARGIRFSLARPELFAMQLRAILRGVPPTQCRIMLPMIVDAGELRAARRLLDEIRAELGIETPVPLGVMIETPAAALLAESLARDADFLSIGSNDLTQYALAADRGNPAVAAMIDALHPAVLHLIARAAEGAAAHGRWLGVCGGIASDPMAAAVLIGLGVTELSATPAAIPALKAKIRTLTVDDCRALAARALAASTAAEVRALLKGDD